MLVLGIESSCDETGAAVVKDGREMLSNVISSSVDLHKAYGGVVPEIAARSHIEVIIPVIQQSLTDAKVGWKDIDAIAVTQGPGLLGSLLIGVLTARTLAIAKQKRLFAVNHVAAHPYAAFLTEKAKGYQLTANSLSGQKLEFPLLALTASGGHTQLVLMKDAKSQKLLGQSLDDAAGEAYDKVAKMLGLPYPGGPELAELAKKGDAKAFNFPKAKLEKAYDFSFSGLKTAVLRTAQKESGHDYTFPSHQLPKVLSEAQKANLAASFQRVVNETLIEKLKKAEEQFNPKMIVISGGVAANQDLHQQITHSDFLKNIRIAFPPVELCTDNAAMIASAAFYQQNKADPYSLNPNPALNI
jgi:N6-L-threonylcarbamoyladenine synthase